MDEKITVRKNTLLLFGGVLVVALGLFVMFGNAPQPQQPTIVTPIATVDGVQEVSIRALSNGLYDPQEVVVKKGVPVKLTFTAEPGSGCGQILMMRQFGVQLLSRNGEAQSATFIPAQEGTYEYSCSMRMFIGRMRVVA